MTQPYKVNDAVLVPHGTGTLVGRIQELYANATHERAVVLTDMGTISVPLSEVRPTPALEGRWRLDAMRAQEEADVAKAQVALRRDFPATVDSTDANHQMQTSCFVIGYKTALRDGRKLAYDDDNEVITSAEFGEALLVKIEWSTDFDGREIDPGKEEYPCTYHGPFFWPEQAQEWMDAYPEDTDVHDMTTVPLNNVRPN